LRERISPFQFERIEGKKGVNEKREGGDKTQMVHFLKANHFRVQVAEQRGREQEKKA